MTVAAVMFDGFVSSWYWVRSFRGLSNGVPEVWCCLGIGYGGNAGVNGEPWL